MKCWMVLLPVILLSSCLSLTINQQTYPYISFRGEILPNHSYLDISQVKDSGPGSLKCHTDLETCCSSDEGSLHRGDWFFPNMFRVPFDSSNNIFESHGNQTVELRRRPDSRGPSGIYNCTIPTAAPSHRDRPYHSVYVGLYSHDEGMYVCSCDNEIATVSTYYTSELWPVYLRMSCDHNQNHVQEMLK